MKNPLIIILAIISSTIFSQESTVWKFTTKDGIYSSPVADSINIYFGSNDSCLYALNKNNGNLSWKYKAQGQINSKPLIYNQSIIINCSNGLLYSLNKLSGEILWTFKTEGEKKLDIWDYYISSPCIHDGMVIVGSGDHNIYSIDANTGELTWKFKTEGIIHASPIIHQGVILVGSFDGYFYALDGSTGSLIWKFKTVGDRYFPKGEIQKSAAVYKNTVVFGSRDFNIYSLNLTTGRGLWNYKEKGSWIIATPLVYLDNLYFGTSDTHRFLSFSAKSGDINWSLPLNMRVYASAVPYKGSIYFGCFNGKLYGANYNTGEIIQTFQTEASKHNYHTVFNEDGKFKRDFELYGSNMRESENNILQLGAILSTPLIENGVLFFGDATGVFYAVKLQ